MLALTKKTGYGLIAMAHLARLEPYQVASAREIADRFGVPVSLLMNVLKELATSGWVESIRGVHGGYRLARPKEQISVADLINTLEGPIRLTECVAHGVKVSDGAICEAVDRCPIADPVHRVQRKLSDFLKSVTLAEIADPAMVK